MEVSISKYLVFRVGRILAGASRLHGCVPDCELRWCTCRCVRDTMVGV